MYSWFSRQVSQAELICVIFIVSFISAGFVFFMYPMFPTSFQDPKAAFFYFVLAALSWLALQFVSKAAHEYQREQARLERYKVHAKDI